jgi:hypothetical protein
MAGSCTTLPITSNQCDLDVRILLVTFPVYRPDSPRFEFLMAFLEGSSPVLAWGLNRVIRRRRPLASEGKG